MGNFTHDTIKYLYNSSEAQRALGIIDGVLGNSSKDAVINMLADSLTRMECEFQGIKSDIFKPNELVGASMDGGPAFQIPDLTHYDKTQRFVEYGDKDILKHLQNTSTMPVGPKEQKFILDDYTGSYERSTSDSTTLPMVSLTGASYSIFSEMGNGGLSWSQQDMDEATFSGRPLDTMNIRALRRAYIENIYKLVIYGNDKIQGLIGTVSEIDVKDTVANPNGVTLATPAAKYWSNKTGREIVSDLTDARKTIATASNSLWGGSMAGIDTGIAGSNPASFTCPISQEAYYVMLDKYMTNDSGGDRPETVWSYLQTSKGKIQTGIEKYVIVYDFDSAFGAGTKAGFMLLPNSTDAYSFETPLTLTPKPVQFQDLKMVVPYYDYFAGLKLIRDYSLISYTEIALV